MAKYYSLATEGNSADLYIFGDITSLEWLESDVSSYTLAKEIQRLSVDSINVHINSYGGEVAEALAIYNTLKRHQASVTTYVDGFACSAATIVFMAGDTRIMSSVGNFLVHPAWAMAMGNADDLRREADNLDAITEQSITAYMEHVTKTREELIELMKDERFLTPDEVLEWGFANVVEELEDTERPAASVQSLIHEKLMEETNMKKMSLDAYDAIEEIKKAVAELSDEIKQAEDDEEEDTEIDIEVDTDEESEESDEDEADEEESDTDDESEEEDEPDDDSDEDEKPENREAGMMACFLKALSETKGD